MLEQARFCWECYNFEDRGNIDGTVVCAKNHRPGVSCDDFIDKYEKYRETGLKTRFCLECANFEDRRDIDGTVVCAKNHRPGVSCDDFIEKCCYYRACSSCEDFIEDMKC